MAKSGGAEVEHAEQDMFLAERGKVAAPEHIASRDLDGCLISEQDVEFWRQNGFLRIPRCDLTPLRPQSRRAAGWSDRGGCRLRSVFTPEEMDDLERDFEWLVSDWTEAGPGWQGPWRKVLMDEKTEEKSQLIAMHDLHHYSDSWMTAITKPSVGEALGKMIGPNVEVPPQNCARRFSHPLRRPKAAGLTGAAVGCRSTTARSTSSPQIRATPSRCIKISHSMPTRTCATPAP